MKGDKGELEDSGLGDELLTEGKRIGVTGGEWEMGGEMGAHLHGLGGQGIEKVG